MVVSILEILSALPDGARAARAASKDWTSSVTLLRRHGIAAYFHYATRSANASIPEEPAAALERSRLSSVAGSLRVLTTLKRALEVLAKAGVAVIPLKGWTLAQSLYPDPSLRTMSDVDLLVRPEDQDRALLALTHAGGTVEHTRSYEHRHHLEPIHGIGPTKVELHLRAIVDYGAVMPAAPLFDRASKVDVEGHPALALAREDLFLYLAAHAVGHTFERLGWLLDLALLVRSTPIDWEVVSRNAHEFGLTGALAWTAALLERIDVPIPVARGRFVSVLSANDALIEQGWIAKTMVRRNLVRAMLADSKWKAGRHAIALATERAASAARGWREIAVRARGLRARDGEGLERVFGDDVRR